MIVNRAFVQQVLAATNPLGRRVREAARDDDDDGRDRSLSLAQGIVGVVDDLHTNTVDPALVKPALYHPLPIGRSSSVTVIVRISGGGGGIVPAVCARSPAVVDPTVPPDGISG